LQNWRGKVNTASQNQTEFAITVSWNLTKVEVCMCNTNAHAHYVCTCVQVRAHTYLRTLFKTRGHLGGNARKAADVERFSHIWMNIGAFPHIEGDFSTYKAFQPFPPKFPHIWG